jgi:hypothetical protein
MIGGGFGGFRLHRYGGIVPILVIRSIIQIGVTVRIAVGIPVNRPDKRLKKDAIVAIRETPVFISMKETRVFISLEKTAVLIKCDGRRRREVTANSGSHPECCAGTVGNEPTPQTATVEPTAARGRVRGSSE